MIWQVAPLPQNTLIPTTTLLVMIMVTHHQDFDCDDDDDNWRPSENKGNQCKHGHSWKKVNLPLETIFFVSNCIFPSRFFLLQNCIFTTCIFQQKISNCMFKTCIFWACFLELYFLKCARLMHLLNLLLYEFIISCHLCFSKYPPVFFWLCCQPKFSEDIFWIFWLGKGTATRFLGSHFFPTMGQCTGNQVKTKNRVYLLFQSSQTIIKGVSWKYVQTRKIMWKHTEYTCCSSPIRRKSRGNPASHSRQNR